MLHWHLMMGNLLDNIEKLIYLMLIFQEVLHFMNPIHLEQEMIIAYSIHNTEDTVLEFVTIYDFQPIHKSWEMLDAKYYRFPQHSIKQQVHYIGNCWIELEHWTIKFMLLVFKLPDIIQMILIIIKHGDIQLLQIQWEEYLQHVILNLLFWYQK